MNQNIINKSNSYLANVGVEYIKLHNLHWNVVGLQFKAVHEYLESLYDSMADVLDEVAEVIKMNGGTPLASLKDYLQNTSINELESKDYKISESLNIVLNDMKLLKAQVESLRLDAANDDLYSIVTMCEDHLENYNKTIWFIESMLK